MNRLDDPRARPGHCPRLVSPPGTRGEARACGRKGTIEHEGKRYCRQHAPERTDVSLTAVYTVYGDPPRVHVAYGVLTDKQWTAHGNPGVAFLCHRRLLRAEVDLTPEAAIERWRAHRRRELADTLALVEELRALVDAKIDPAPVSER